MSIDLLIYSTLFLSSKYSWVIGLVFSNFFFMENFLSTILVLFSSVVVDNVQGD